MSLLRAAKRRIPGFSRRGHATQIPTVPVSELDIERLAHRKQHSLTLADLVQYGRPPLILGSLYDSANFSLSLLPTRLAHRIQALRNLPFIVVTNPHISQIHNNYVHSLSTLLPYAERPITTPEEEGDFTQVMAGLVKTHTNTVPILARGLLESRKYISPIAVTKFLDEHLRARIGTRLIAEQHIALHNSSLWHESEVEHSNYIGVIDTALRPAEIVRSCESFVSEICELNYGVRPTLLIDGEPDTAIAHVPVHLEYVMTELLKNAFRATVENGKESEPIQVTIAPTPELTEADLPTAATPGQCRKSQTTVEPLTDATPGVTIRIRDRGGGIAPENMQKLWTYGFTTFNEREASDASADSGTEALNIMSGVAGSGSSLAGLGYGLPLGRAYAEYFGGGIAVQSLHGWGTDVYLTLRGVCKVG